MRLRYRKRFWLRAILGKVFKQLFQILEVTIPQAVLATRNNLERQIKMAAKMVTIPQAVLATRNSLEPLEVKKCLGYDTASGIGYAQYPTNILSYMR